MLLEVLWLTDRIVPSCCRARSSAQERRKTNPAGKGKDGKNGGVTKREVRKKITGRIGQCEQSHVHLKTPFSNPSSCSSSFYPLSSSFFPSPWGWMINPTLCDVQRLTYSSAGQKKNCWRNSTSGQGNKNRKLDDTFRSLLSVCTYWLTFPLS